jgi:hypothetical protein
LVRGVASRPLARRSRGRVSPARKRTDGTRLKSRGRRARLRSTPLPACPCAG